MSNAAQNVAPAPAPSADAAPGFAAPATPMAVHAWSLHRTLGRFVAEHANPPGSTAMTPTPAAPGAVDMLDLPRELAAHGIGTVQLCHFHLPRRDRSYLEELRAALAEAEVALDALLVDNGDLVHPTDADAHEAWIAGWLEDAAVLGATRGRVCAGESDPTPELIAASGARLSRLATGSPVRVVTENWKQLLPTADDVHALLDATGGSVGLLIDLDNWTMPGRDQQLASIAGRAETSHAKCPTTEDGALDPARYRRTLEAVLGAGYDGPLCLVYAGADDDEWAGLAACQQVVDAVRTDG
ncbi:sugar phosphate isomerase/epimerase family protein [Brachybacterium phenoliresistens]|uniref:sugar phosphate isomerase/epimerase family protein n=1 Tax=Brachybacterium phenoliresistens TaxID=396014 RepID=UPI0031D1DDC7